MNTPTPGLRRLFNKSNDVAKVSLVIPAGDEVVVSDYVAEQLGAAFGPLTEAPAADPAPAAKPAKAKK